MDHSTEILIIDDEPDNFDVIDTMLTDDNFTIFYSASGTEALEKFNAGIFHPDLILLDIMMPQMSGIEFCEIFKANPEWQPIPIIVVTALTGKVELARCLQAGADDFISKPIHPLELRARIKSMLRIKRQQDELRDVIQLRQDFSDILVHDMRNPLSTIALAAEILNVAEYHPDRQEKKTRQIINAARQLQAMVDDLLLVAKVNSGTMILQTKIINLIDLCNRALDDIRYTAEHKQLKIMSHLPPAETLIEVDASIFRRVLDNLLANAIKFSPTNGQITFRVETGSDDQTRIQVIDQGPGIKPEFKQTIFQKFKTGDSFAGVPQIGLGLYFCKLALEAHGGTIYVEDNYPTGSIFTVEI